MYSAGGGGGGGEAFLLYRDGDGEQRIAALERGRAGGDRPPERQRRAAVVGRRGLALHCEIAWSGGEWTISDDGLSRNGTFVDDERLTERRRLRDGEVIRAGATRLAFRDPAAACRPPRRWTPAAPEAGAARATASERSWPPWPARSSTRPGARGARHQPRDRRSSSTSASMR